MRSKVVVILFPIGERFAGVIERDEESLVVTFPVFKPTERMKPNAACTTGMRLYFPQGSIHFPPIESFRTGFNLEFPIGFVSPSKTSHLN